MICPLCDQAYDDVRFHLIWDCPWPRRDLGIANMQLFCPCGFQFWANARRAVGKPSDYFYGHFGTDKTVEEHILKRLRS
jgi:hypothetical protein